jgi:hypothetical protein
VKKQGEADREKGKGRKNPTSKAVCYAFENKSLPL